MVSTLRVVGRAWAGIVNTSCERTARSASRPARRSRMAGTRDGNHGWKRGGGAARRHSSLYVANDALVTIVERAYGFRVPRNATSASTCLGVRVRA